MKSLLIIFSFLCLSLLGQQDHSHDHETSTPSHTTALTVHVHDLGSDEGQVMVALYDSEGHWLSKNLMGSVSEIKDKQATVVFDNVPYGTYAISTFHDKDKNGKLKTGLFGIPKEPYASSRGAKGMFGPPKWKDAIFTLDADSHTETINF